MAVTFARCAGLAIHQASVVAGVLVAESGGAVRKAVRSFGTLTADLLAWSDTELAQQQVTPVALESTAVDGKPRYHLVQGACALRLVHAQHRKALPGRKTDPSCLRASRQGP